MSERFIWQELTFWKILTPEFGNHVPWVILYGGTMQFCYFLRNQQKLVVYILIFYFNFRNSILLCKTSCEILKTVSITVIPPTKAVSKRRRPVLTPIIARAINTREIRFDQSYSRASQPLWLINAKRFESSLPLVPLSTISSWAPWNY